MAETITQTLQSKHPVVQAPMYGVTTPEMVAAASAAGCLGSLPLGDLSAKKCKELIRKTKDLTRQPFAVNLFVNDVPVVNESLKRKYAEAKRFIEHLAREHGLAVHLSSFDDITVSTFHEQLEVIISEDIKLVSFTFGNLDEASVQLFRSNGVKSIGTCTSVAEAKILENTGIDIICVQGWEAGGHRGSFLAGEVPQTGGFSLLAQVYDAVKVPLIYAGGIYNATTLLAAKKLGAQAFQIGSLLLRSKESALKDFEKERLVRVKEDDIILTNTFSGRYARGIRNIFTDALSKTDLVLPYPYQNKLTGELRRAAKAAANADFVSIWRGQSVAPLSEESTTNILKALINETAGFCNRFY